MGGNWAVTWLPTTAARYVSFATTLKVVAKLTYLVAIATRYESMLATHRKKLKFLTL